MFERGDKNKRWGDRARQRARMRADSELIGELRWQWRCACMATTLAPIVYTPSGATRAVPVIRNLDLGPPVTLKVQVRPGQTLGDFEAAAPTIASAMNVADVQVAMLAPGWLQIVLRPDPYAGPGAWGRFAS